MKVEYYKTLVWKETGIYARILTKGLYTSGIPELMNIKSEISDLKSVFPDLDFSQVELITIRVTRI